VAAPGKAPTATPIFNTTDLAAHLKGIRILLVEDNDFNALVAREELEDAIEEVHVAVAENGAIAVEKVKMDDFEVILMDVQMPVMNGYEATEKIRSMGNEKSSVPIIAMTANVMKDEVDRCYEAGMDDFIGKPFDTGELLSKIHQLQKQAI
jgi:CheY-like chemotaxis protein